MMIPIAMIELHKSDASFDEFSGHKALASEAIGGILIDPIHIESLLSLIPEIH